MELLRLETQNKDHTDAFILLEKDELSWPSRLRVRATMSIFHAQAKHTCQYMSNLHNDARHAWPTRIRLACHEATGYLLQENMLEKGQKTRVLASSIAHREMITCSSHQA
jgi:hypothetical protein